MRLLLLVVNVFAFATSWAAQPPTLPELKKYSDEIFKFSVLMPGQPPDPIGGESGYHRVSLLVNPSKQKGKQTEFAVTRESAKDLLKADAAAVKKALDEYRDRIARSYKGKVTEEK